VAESCYFVLDKGIRKYFMGQHERNEDK
jgi:hypothetical protein